MRLDMYCWRYWRVVRRDRARRAERRGAAQVVAKGLSEVMVDVGRPWRGADPPAGSVVLKRGRYAGMVLYPRHGTPDPAVTAGIVARLERER